MEFSCGKKFTYIRLLHVVIMQYCEIVALNLCICDLESKSNNV